MAAIKLYLIMPRCMTIQSYNMKKECILDRFKNKFPGTEYTLVNTYECKDVPDGVVDKQLWYLGKSIQNMATADIILISEDAVDDMSCTVELCAATTYHLPQIQEVELGLRFSEFENAYHYIFNLIQEIEEDK